MEKHTASYTDIKNSFVIQNLDKPDTVEKYYSLFCVMKNILMRGSPSRPSVYLLSELGEINDSAQGNEPLWLFSKEIPQWNQRIKGYSDNNDYPAETFFYTIIPEFIPEYQFIQTLLLPEALIQEIVPDAPSEFEAQQVDFYLPQAKLIIEIDGEQHKKILQRQKDNVRDAYFKKHGITVIRIAASSIKNQDAALKHSIDAITEILSTCADIRKYAHIFENSNYYTPYMHRLAYDVVMRFQILLLSMLQNEMLSLTASEWEFSLACQFPDSSRLLRVAFEDICLWLEHLCKLCKLPFRKPKIRINEEQMTNPLKIDLDIFKRWTDEYEMNPNTIYIRNDYFDDADYFCVSTSESIRYQVEINENYSDELSLKFLLKNLFGYDDFNDGQLPIIAHALGLNDTIGILPTGSGKSLCYQLCCLLQPTVNFVVSPILSLIYDQKQNLDEFGITRTAYITSDQTVEEKNSIIKDFGRGRYLLVWISPERFQTIAFRETLQQINFAHNFSYAVIDEVHCLSEWGHDFRTSYLNLVKTIRQYCPQATLLGLTATASQFVLEDLKKEFGIRADSIKSVSSMSRKELSFHIVKSEYNSKYNTLLQILNNLNSMNNQIFELRGEQPSCGLIFTVAANGDKGCKNVATKLSSDLKIKTSAYYANLDYDVGKGQKKAVQEAFKQNQTPLMVATKAFGMGVNKKNICYTIHYGLPWSIEAFYQEAGRAGRAGQKSDCYILYSPEPCEKEILDEIFALRTDIERLNILRAQLSSDLSSILYLWQQNNDGVDADLEMMRWVMNSLSKSQSTIICCDEEHKKSPVEKAIYRLTLLGFVSDWTVIEWGEKNGKFNLIVNEYSLDTIRHNFIEYIRRYDSVFSLEDTAEKYRAYQSILGDTSLKPYARYMKALLQWSYDNIVYSRRQSINNIRVLCDSNMDSDQIKLYVDNYFKFSETTILLDNIVAKPNDYLTWFDLLYTKNTEDGFQILFEPISVVKANEILVSLQRYLESYRFNTGLNFAAGILLIMCGKFYDTDALERFDDAFGTIDTFDMETQNAIMNECLKFGSSIEHENRMVLGDYLASRYPHKAVEIYNALQDLGSLTVALGPMEKRLNKIKEKITW
ncbi:RecQ family ATP-dependent DNA helicase [Acetanaerobacterium elongatum]|uniref:DNA 3'-5' helicase n=1 Tax=Acetanaerobacterium elongatum TaxID=258515 RepID=A0A1G9YPF6_9FIRM|nr:RecQ family ATP-dependent DNA helicase [Acetanaerobacterium elongatum]SDN11079.1 ATP-dependent DNA helicase RecQ [Acetanaerobacterium elongatum]